VYFFRHILAKLRQPPINGWGHYAKTVTFPNKTILGLSFNFGQFDKPVAYRLRSLAGKPQKPISNPLKNPASSIENRESNIKHPAL
jgi:hypothetical protein